MQQYWVYIIVFAILLVNMIVGIRKGMIRMLYSLLSTAIAICAAVAILTASGEYLKTNVPIYANIEERCVAMLQTTGTNAIGSGGGTVTEEGDPASFLVSGLLSDGTELLNNVIEESGIYHAIGERLATIIFYILMFLLLFFAIKILLFVIMKALETVAKLPGFSGMNRLLGAGLGIVQGIVFVWAFFLLVTINASSDLGQAAITAIQAQPILKSLFEHNLILSVIQAFAL